MSGSLDKIQRQMAKVEELFGTDAGAIEDEINQKLKEGWTYKDIIIRGNKIFLVFIR